MWPFKPAWQSPDENKRLAAVEKMDRSGLSTLLELARNNSDSKVQSAAIGKIVALWSQDDAETKTSSVGALGSADRVLLAEIAQHDVHWQVRCAAISQMATFTPLWRDDLESITLANIAQSDANEDVRVVAVESTRERGEHDDLCELIDHMPIPFQQREALKPNTVYATICRNRLVEVTKHDASKRVRDAALKKLTNPGALGDIAKTADNEATRTAAHAKLMEAAGSVTKRHQIAVDKYPSDHPFRKPLEQSVRECRRALDLVGETQHTGDAAASPTPTGADGGGMAAALSDGQARINKVEVFFEPSGAVAAALAGGSVVSFLNDTEAVRKALRTADAQLGLSDTLMRFVAGHADTPQVETMPEMDESRWAVFLNERYNSSSWLRWHGKTSQGRWNVVCTQQLRHAPNNHIHHIVAGAPDADVKRSAKVRRFHREQRTLREDSAGEADVEQYADRCRPCSSSATVVPDCWRRSD